jgi:hypothetical protein
MGRERVGKGPDVLTLIEKRKSTRCPLPIRPIRRDEEETFMIS